MFFKRKEKEVVYTSTKGRIIKEDGYYIPQTKRWFGWDDISQYCYFRGYIGTYKFTNLSDAKKLLHL